MASKYTHHDPLGDGNKPERFPNSRHDRPKPKKKVDEQARRSPASQGKNVSDENIDEAASGFGPGYGTGLGRRGDKGFGGGRQAHAGYGGEQYLGGNNDPEAGDEYGRPQPTKHNASTGSGSQYSAAKGHTPSPDENEKPQD